MKPMITDAQLVELSRSGDREAFAWIVQKYQSLVCALTYSACGDIQASEDLAQMTFITAWSEMPKLQEPSKLKSWLCGIARNIARNSLREQRSVPIDKAQSLEQIDNFPSDAPSPCAAAISKEEEMILWRTLNELPPTYREPLVLYYRQQQSVGEVAELLNLTEDAVHQRLSRGRMMLSEKVTHFVEKALRNTGPAKTFSVAVLAALPLLATPSKAAGISIATTKASATAAKATGLSVLFQMFLMLTPIATIGGYLGYRMSRDTKESMGQRESVAAFWQILAVSLVTFVAIPLIVAGLWIILRFPVMKETVFSGLKVWLGILYAVVLSALGFWLWQRRPGKPLNSMATKGQKATTKRRFAVSIVISVIGSGCLLIAFLSDANFKVQHLSSEGVRQLAATAGQKSAQFFVLHSQDGTRRFWIRLNEKGNITKLSAPFDASTYDFIKEHGFSCPVHYQGRDYEILGWPGYLLGPFCAFILALGTILLMKQPRKDRNL